MSKLIPHDYKTLLADVKSRIRHAQYAALKAVNKEMISLYWDIGQMIVSRQQGETWGKSIVEQLAKDLQTEFIGVKGFSMQNLWYMRSFYLAYKDIEKLQSMIGEIGWTHNTIILDKCKDDLEREFYIRMTRKFSWTTRVLQSKIKSQTYEKTLLNQTNFEQTVSEDFQLQAKLAVKDEYLFDFLELGDEFTERQLENALVEKVNHFLREMGGMFTFVGTQYRLQVSDNEYFIDVLLYHRGLKSLVAIELKRGKFLPEYVGKMQFYLAVLNDTVRLADENPAIGIILCKDKDKTVVEYALQDSKSLVGVAKYELFSIVPEDLREQLPTVEQISNLLQGID